MFELIGIGFDFSAHRHLWIHVFPNIVCVSLCFVFASYGLLVWSLTSVFAWLYLQASGQCLACCSSPWSAQPVTSATAVTAGGGLSSGCCRWESFWRFSLFPTLTSWQPALHGVAARSRCVKCLFEFEFFRQRVNSSREFIRLKTVSSI